MEGNKDFVDLDLIAIDPACVMKVPAEFALQKSVLPLCMVDGDFIVAMADPSEVKTIAALRGALGVPVIAKQADPESLNEYLLKLYGSMPYECRTHQIIHCRHGVVTCGILSD